MFWDLISGYYDLFEKLFNGKVNRKICKMVAAHITSNDEVLECACGSGMISIHIAAAGRYLTATDYSDGMLAYSRNRCKDFKNVKVEKANILHLTYADESFDKVVAANVIHLLEHPEIALGELLRVCRKGGEVIIPTYLASDALGLHQIFGWAISRFTKTSIRRFNKTTYRAFFKRFGLTDISYELIKGRMDCYIAIIKK